MRNRAIWTAVFAASLSTLAAPMPASAQIGTVAAVNQEMQGTPPQQNRRALFFGDGVVTDELIETSQAGSGQLLFEDRSSLSVGPNSAIVLDRYIYDPDRQTGDIAVSLTVGTLRFIGGQITKGGDAIIRTPKATIALRGGMVTVEVSETGATRVINIASTSVTVTQNGDSNGDGLDDGPGADTGGGSEEDGTVVTRPGAMVEADEDSVQFTGFADAEEMGEIFGSLEGTGGGGTSEPPSSNSVETEIGSVAAENSGALGAAYQQPVSTTGEVQPGSGGASFETGSNGESQAFNTLGQKLASGVEDPLRNLPDPSAIAALTGTATYAGPATGTLSTATGSSSVSGAFAMTYDFGSRGGSIDFNVMDNVFSVDVAASPANAATYAGSDPIFGGPDSVSAEGSFFPGSTHPAASTAGNFQIDLQTQNRSVVGTFEGPRQ